MSDGFRRGDIVSYPDLWRRQLQEKPDREHGEKDRTVCMILTIVDGQGLTHILLLPISSKPPFDGQQALEIPMLELRRAKLTGYARGWITVSECNYDVLERSYYLDQSQPPIGRFSEAFLETIRNHSPRFWRPALRGSTAPELLREGREQIVQTAPPLPLRLPDQKAEHGETRALR